MSTSAAIAYDRSPFSFFYSRQINNSCSFSRNNVYLVALSRSLIPAVTRQRCRDLLPVIVRGREICYEGTFEGRENRQQGKKRKKKVMEENEGRGVCPISDFRRARPRGGSLRFILARLCLRIKEKRSTFYSLQHESDLNNLRARTNARRNTRSQSGEFIIRPCATHL